MRWSAGFPAGTLSGAPKVRAMEIIEELEPSRRGIYAGCIGYFAANGTMDTCIGLRTALVKDGTMYVQAGGGVVADSGSGVRVRGDAAEGARPVARRRGGGTVRGRQGRERSFGPVALHGDFDSKRAGHNRLNWGATDPSIIPQSFVCSIANQES